MNAGTRVARTTVASIRTASVSPTPNNLMKLTDDVAKLRKTTEMSNAAAVMMRPVRARPVATAVGVVAGLVVLLLDAREQEDLVVHRQAEGHAEHQHRRGRVEHSRSA